MKRFFFLIITISLIIILSGDNLVFSQSAPVPRPLMQPSDLGPQPSSTPVNPEYRSTNDCATNNCPPPLPQIRNNQQSTNINIPQKPPPGKFGNIPPPPGQQIQPPPANEGPQNVLIIFDASYSMEEKINGKRKIDVAKRVVYNTVKNIPPDTRVGLRVYGHKLGIIGLYPCRKTELLVPVQFNTSGAIIEKLRSINPTGQTPITYSVKMAVENDFHGLNGPKRIILVSDGMETCDGNPCDYAVEMVRRGIELKVDVVGFALKNPAAINQLKCIALSTGGKFFTADTEAALARSLQNSFHVKKDVQGKILFNK
jgi:hypothetical protein